MATVTVSTLIQAYPKAVFDALTDFARAPRYRLDLRRVEMRTPGPVGVGTCFRETRMILQREASEDVEVIAFEPERQFELKSVAHGAEYHTVYEFRREGACTRLIVKLTATPVTRRARLMWPLAWLLRPIVRKNLRGDLEWTRRIIERENGMPVV